MFDERLEESDETGNELEQYLLLFKKTSEPKVKQSSRKSKSRGKSTVKTEVKATADQQCLLQPKPSYLLENEMVSSSDELLTSSLQQNLKIYNLQELSSTSSDDNSFRLSEDTNSGMDNVVLSLKDLAPSEATLNKSRSNTEEDTSLESFNFKANIFTVRDLVVSQHSDNVTRVSGEVVDESVDKSAVSERFVEDGIKSNTEHHNEPVYKDDFEDTTTYKDDIEGTIYKNDFEDTITYKGDVEQTVYKDDFEGEGSQKDEESLDESVDECIEEECQVSNEIASFTKGNTDSCGSGESAMLSSSSSRSNLDTKRGNATTSDTDKVSQAMLHSESGSTAGDVLKTEVCVSVNDKT